jgi:hypothetical protein
MCLLFVMLKVFALDICVLNQLSINLYLQSYSYTVFNAMHYMLQ